MGWQGRTLIIAYPSFTLIPRRNLLDRIGQVDFVIELFICKYFGTESLELFKFRKKKESKLTRHSTIFFVNHIFSTGLHATGLWIWPVPKSCFLSSNKKTNSYYLITLKWKWEPCHLWQHCLCLTVYNCFAFCVCCRLVDVNKKSL